MSDETGGMTVAQRLGHLLDRGLLPAGGPAEAAERLIERLERPARIAILGLPGAGKSAVLNLLAGTVVVPETLRLPTIIVQHGLEAQMLCTLADGRAETVPGSDLAQVMALNPAMVTLEMDIAALKVISLLEVSAGPMEADQRRAAIWASKRADIVIWCTTSYLPKEQVVWESMPDTVKDNGFLFLTKVDLLGSREAATGMLERVELRAGEEFRQVLSLSAKQARVALGPGGLNRDIFRESGAAAVISTIKTRVQMARRADTDMAELLLARHVEAGLIVAKRFAEPGSETLAELTTGATAQLTPVATEPQSWAPPPEDQIPKSRSPKLVAPEQPASIPEPVAEADPEFDPIVEQDPANVLPGLMARLAEPEPEQKPELTPAPVRSAPVARAPSPSVAPLETSAARVAPPVDAEAASLAGTKRFSDRIKQAPLPEDAPAVERVPLRTTWKSRGEAAAAVPPPPPAVARTARQAATPEPAPEATAVPDAPASVGMNDAAIAAMLAAAASPPGQARVARDRSGGLVRPAEPSPTRERPAGGRLFGGRSTAATPPAAGPAVDLPPLHETAAPDADESSDNPMIANGSALPPVAKAPPPEAQQRQPRPTETAGRARPPVTARQPAPQPAPESPREIRSDLATAADIIASPRVAVLRERRPEPAALERSERRERPRIAARITNAPSAPAPLALADGPIPASEHALLDQAISLIISRSASLTDMIDPEEKLPVDLILEHGRETTEQVIDLLSAGGSAALRRINGDLGEVLDLIMLMQLEKGHAPADDTVTLLLQVRRDLETLRAA